MGRRPLPWPSSKLQQGDLHRLHLASLRTGRRITVMVRTAILAYLDAEEAEAAAQRVAEPSATFDPTSDGTSDMSNTSGRSNTSVEIGHPRGQD
jgi:hypothetical protein